MFESIIFWLWTAIVGVSLGLSLVATKRAPAASADIEASVLAAIPGALLLLERAIRWRYAVPLGLQVTPPGDHAMVLPAVLGFICALMLFLQRPRPMDEATQSWSRIAKLACLLSAITSVVPASLAIVSA